RRDRRASRAPPGRPRAGSAARRACGASEWRPRVAAGTGRWNDPSSALDRCHDLGLGGEELLEAGRGEVEQPVHTRPIEWPALGGALDFDERTGVGADDVEVDV